MTLKPVCRALLCCAAIPALVSATAMAEESPRQLGAHSHGSGTFDLAIDRNYVVGELRVPRMDIIGFETAPKGKAQTAAFVKGMQDLHKAELLVTLPDAAKCEFALATVGMGRPDAASANTETAEAKKDHDHDHDHDHAKSEGSEKTKDAAKAEAGHDHDHGHNHDASESAEKSEETHSEFNVKYNWTCAQPGELASVSFPYFKSFPKAEKLVVQVVRDGAQAQHTVTAAKPEIDLPKAP